MTTSDSPAGGALSRSKLPAPQEGFVVTFFLAVSDKRKSTDFYTKVMGGELVRDAGENEVSVILLANTWLILHIAAGPAPTRRMFTSRRQPICNTSAPIWRSG